jgi:hypothetical protein
MKQIFMLSAVLILTIIVSGCAGIGKPFYHEPHAITIGDAKKIRPFSNLSDRHKRLTAQQSQLINRLFGLDISREGDLIVYYEATKRKGIYGDPGNIFLVHARDESGSLLSILVCTTNSRIDEVLIENSPVLAGKPVIPDEFLQQFIGRSLSNSWELEKAPSDLLSLPSKLRSIAGNPRTSQEVADAIRKVLVWAEVLQIK